MQETKVRNKATTVSLVLGSGGARGLAHIGVIEELEARGFRIEAVAGSSMGALVGGIYARGKLRDYARWVSGLSRADVFALLDWNFSGGGLVRGETVINTLRDMVGDCDIENLPLDYTAVAVDLHRGREVWLSKGPLFDAIRASIAIPGIFTPHSYHGLTLVDGGLLNPVPIAPVLRALTDLCVVVDANGVYAEPGPLQVRESEESEEAGLLERLGSYVGFGGRRPDAVQTLETSRVLMRSLELMQAALTRQHLSVLKPDLLITIPRDACMIHEFHRAEELITLGRRQAAATLDEWRDEAGFGVRG